MKTYNIYTDGACKGNPGPGGAAYIIILDKKAIDKQSVGGYYNTTNGRMELMGVIKGLEAVAALLNEGEQTIVNVFSDSEYVVNSYNKNYKVKANPDLWERLHNACNRINAHQSAGGRSTVVFEHIKGHNGHQWNEEADRLASQAAKNPIVDDLPTKSNNGPRPFDLQAARDGAPVATRDGRRVTINNFDYQYPHDKALILMMGTLEDGSVELWSQRGEIRYDGKESPEDLVMI